MLNGLLSHGSRSSVDYFPRGTDPCNSHAGYGNAALPITAEYAVLDMTQECPHTQCCIVIPVLFTCTRRQLLDCIDNPVLPDASDVSLATCWHTELARWRQFSSILACHLRCQPSFTVGVTCDTSRFGEVKPKVYIYIRGNSIPSPTKIYCCIHT